MTRTHVAVIVAALVLVAAYLLWPDPRESAVDRRTYDVGEGWAKP